MILKDLKKSKKGGWKIVYFNSDDKNNALSLNGITEDIAGKFLELESCLADYFFTYNLTLYGVSVKLGKKPALSFVFATRLNEELISCGYSRVFKKPDNEEIEADVIPRDQEKLKKFAIVCNLVAEIDALVDRDLHLLLDMAKRDKNYNPDQLTIFDDETETTEENENEDDTTDF